MEEELGVRLTNGEGIKRYLSQQLTIEDFIEDGRKNLVLTPSEKYRLVLEEDGSEILNFKLLANFAKVKPFPVVMILAADEEWKDPIERKRKIAEKRNSIQPRHEDAVSTTQPSSSSLNCDKSISNIIKNIPWNTIVPEGFTNGKNKAYMKKDFNAEMAKYIVKTCKREDFGKPLIRKFATEMHKRYPLAYESINWENGGTAKGDEELQSTKRDEELQTTKRDGLEVLTERLKDAVRFRYGKLNGDKIPEPKNKKGGKRNYGTEQDSYGCVAYEPDLPEGETEELQDKKKEELLKDFEEQHLESKKKEQLWRETYPTQRVVINRQNGEKTGLQNIKNQFPHITVPFFFLIHASTLLGKDIGVLWASTLKSKGEVCVQYFKNQCLTKGNRKTCPQYIRNCDEAIKKAQAASENTKSVLPNSILIFNLLKEYFKDEAIFSIVDPGISDEALLQMEDSEKKPMLIIKGFSEYDENLTCSTLVDNTLLMESNDVLQGVLMTFLVHFVYGFNYHSKKTRTWEFIQRVFMEITCTKGHKRTGKNLAIRDRKVSQLIDDIMETL